MAEKAHNKAHEDTLLVTAAKTIGKAAAKVASAVGVEGAAPARSVKPKLPKKNKSRLPRKQKKAQKKAADTRAA